MATNAQKTPVARSLEAFAQRKARLAIGLLGKSLPCSVVSVDGWIVTVSFNLASTAGFTIPNVTVPVAGSPYIYLPLQPGATGVCIAADAPLDGNPVDLSLQANLSCLFFVPLGSKNFGAPTSTTKTELLGPDGMILRKADDSVALTLDASGAVVKVPLGKSLVVQILPLSAAGLPSGSLWRSGTQVMVVP